VDAVDKVVAPDVTSHDLTEPSKGCGEPLGCSSVASHATCPGFRFTIDDIVVEGNKIAVH